MKRRKRIRGTFCGSWLMSRKQGRPRQEKVEAWGALMVRVMVEPLVRPLLMAGVMVIVMVIVAMAFKNGDGDVLGKSFKAC